MSIEHLEKNQYIFIYIRKKILLADSMNEFFGYVFDGKCTTLTILNKAYHCKLVKDMVRINKDYSQAMKAIK